MDILGLINSYIRVVETGSIAAAARAQGMSAAAVSQSLARLEAHVGVRLLSRTTRSMALTESGARYFEKVRHIPGDIDLASQAAAVATEPQGGLCIATTAAFGRHVLAPLMPAFKAAYPRIDIELISTDRRVDHRLEGVDISLRIEAQLNDRLVARRIASRPFVICASPDYLDRAGIPVTPEELQQHACLVFRYPTDGRFLPWNFVMQGRRFEAKLNPAFVCDDIDMLAQIAVNGGGIVRLASFVAQPLIDSGRLLPLFESDSRNAAAAELVPMDIYACVTELSALNTKVRAFIDFLERAMQVESN
ncbi:LysR family transcriptional regulator [Pseudomonas gingeri]|uniref:LysR family transcriptional regulator n=1 Tax=Pseudomonas gingeri TaxID=117681 RepID=UPI0015A389BA|nr:LysR family transcriptional regulator [Pseudomonas gingeri]NWA24929.1 LysR family transcriptional regulator [Pseudomonas gingeri]NWD71759.1 LysR family transcriptional regulator [Pseudomonas gingeri]NWD74949.1 LysR family transcriptional regulator [Pseudomonas gingeri]